MVSGARNTGVTWSISPSVGTMSNGFYVAPSVITVPQTVTLTAISMEDPSKTGSAVLSLMPNSGISVSAVALLTVVPSFAVAHSKDTINFNAMLNGAPVAAAWSIAPPVGTMSGGVYRAPSSIKDPQTVIVTATNLADASQIANATVSLLPNGAGSTGTPISVAISPVSSSLTAGQSERFSAVVSGTRNTGVTWALSPSIGTMSNGFYVAPNTISSPQTVIVTAISMADPSRTASAPVTLLPSGGSPAGTPPPTVSIQVSPFSASLGAGQSSQFSATVSGTQNTAVNWSLVPQIGSIVNGFYTAPATINSQTSVTVMATSAADPTKTASAAITLQPATVTLSLSPSSVWLTHGQSAQFSASVGGTSNTGVTWSLTPAVGSITNGLYTAPASVTSQQSVTVTATSNADPTKKASATVTLAVVSMTMTPTSISLTAGASSQFSAVVTGTLNTGVAWSMAPGFGSVVNGLYTAPSTISSAQTVTLTATSLADPTQSAHATISLVPNVTTTLSVTPSQVSLSASQTQQFSAIVNSGGIGGGAPASATWTVSPAVGNISQTGLYTAPGSISAQQTIMVTATSSSGSASAMVTLTAGGSAPPPGPATTQILLPVEVMGAAGTTVPVSFNVSSGVTGTLQLWMQIHGLKYQTEASVQFNNGAWIPINDSTVTLQGLASAYGGIGGGFATLSLTINLPSGSVVAGQNVLNFRFNGTDGVTSGFRVLALNVLSNGTQLIPPSAFVQDDPNTWQPPLNTAADIQAGQTLWRSASLIAPGFGAIQAKCADCHAQDGRDLKYFNYSNLAIRARSVFHGLTPQQGDQIASYIRSLNVTNPGRPWNPPYQPGPGMDSKPVEMWAAGAGLDAVLNTDMDMLQYLAPGGNTSSWAATANVNAREIPIAMQLPDWNAWLPHIHPMDAWGSSFTSSDLATYYPLVRNNLVAGNPTSYVNDLSNFNQWYSGGAFLLQFTTGTQNWTADHVNKVYSTWLWMLVKHWEVNQEFRLEGLAQAVHGSNADPRAWWGGIPFMASPNMLHIPVGAPGIHNGTPQAWHYFTVIWYQLQLILNDTDHAFGSRPIDWGYVYGTLKDLSVSDSSPQASLMLLWLVKGLQTLQFDGGPELGVGGWHPGIANYNMLVYPGDFANIWTGYSAMQRASLTEAYLQQWLAKATTFTPQQWYQGGWASPTEVPVPNFNTDFGTWTYYDVPQFRYWGVSDATVRQLADWAKTVWPLGNWSLAETLVCTGSPGATQGTCPVY